MKNIIQLLIATLVATLFAIESRAVTLPYYDAFDYAEGNLNAVASGNWIVGNGSTTFEIAVSNSAALTAPAGFVAASGKGVRRSPSGTARRSVLTYPAITATDGNVLYVSFLLNVATAPAASQIILHLDNSSGSVTSPDLAIFVDNGPKVGIGKNSGTVGFNIATNLAAGTHLVVARYRFQTGNDAVDLWVDPSSSDYNAPTAPTALGSTTNSGDALNIGFCQIATSSGAGGLQYIDEFRIGTTWAEVVPSGAPVVSEKLGFTTQPANAAPAATMSPIVVQVQNAGGASASSNGVPVTLALTAGSGTLSGTLTQNTDASGKATFSNLSINTAGAGKQLTATASGIGAGITAATSATFSIVAPSLATQLAFTTQPGNALTNAAINSIVVQIRDASSVNVSTNGVPITLTLTTGTGTLNGTTTQNTDGTGKATFTGLNIDQSGSKQLTAAASGIGAGLANALSASFTITNGTGGGGGGSGGDLYITGAASVPTGLRVQGTNNTGGIFTQILGASSPDAPTNNWIIVNYQTGDANGLVTFTNPVSPALPKAFYRLRTGDTVTKLEPPSIGVPPVSQIVSPGATATFTVTATGPQLQYLWFFNGNPIPGATTSSLVIPNAQAGNVGNYFVAVANPAGNVNSVTVTLGVGNIAPIITSNPANQTNNAGGTAIFNVAATGTSPLSYQWYFNNSTPLSGKTNSQLLLSAITTNNAGNYRCTVTNAFGSATSANASLTVNPVPTALPDTNMVGFAAVAGVTGGTGGSVTNVTTYAALRAVCRAAGPIIIQVDGVIVPNEAYCYVEGFDKTIVGVGTNSGLAGAGFRLNGTNIIVQNMSFTSTNSNSDGVTIDNSSHGTGRNIWVDHCTFYACTDGSLDVTKGADYVTVSWCKFSYEAVAPGVVLHEFVNLIGSSDSDVGDYHVTFHHNWYGEYCRERMPSVRFGRVHCFNNYYDCAGNNYCVRTRINAQVLVENNYFLGVQNPWERFITSGTPGLLKAAGNITNSCTFVNGWVSGAVVIPGNDTLTDPSLTSSLYPYTLTTTTDVPYYIQTYSGNGKYPYVP